MNNRRIWFRLGGVLAAAAVCTGGAAVVSDRAQEAKNVQRAFLGAMEMQMQIGCYPSEIGSPADLTERERTELQTAYTSRVEQYYTEENPRMKRIERRTCCGDKSAAKRKRKVKQSQAELL